MSTVSCVIELGCTTYVIKYRYSRCKNGNDALWDICIYVVNLHLNLASNAIFEMFMCDVIFVHFEIAIIFFFHFYFSSTISLKMQIHHVIRRTLESTLLTAPCQKKGNLIFERKKNANGMLIFNSHMWILSNALSFLLFNFLLLFFVYFLTLQCKSWYQPPSYLWVQV